MKADQNGPQTIDEYIAGFPRATQGVLQRLRRTIRKALPDAEEAISYKIPAFRLRGRNVLYFAGWKEHYSLYPSTDRLAAAFRKELAPYELSGKGTIRFPLAEPIPVKLIEGIARFRAKEEEQRKKAKAAAKKH